MDKPFPIPIAMFLQESQPTAAQRFGAQLTRWALNFSLVGALLGVGFFGYIMLWPISTLHYNHLPLPVLTKTLHPGDPILLLVDYCKDLSNSEHVVGQIVGTDSDHVILAMGGWTVTWSRDAMRSRPVSGMCRPTPNRAATGRPSRSATSCSICVP